jgi:hypothetical protein
MDLIAVKEIINGVEARIEGLQAVEALERLATHALRVEGWGLRIEG